MNESLQASLKTQLQENLECYENEWIAAGILKNYCKLQKNRNAMKLSASLQASLKTQLQEKLECYENERIAAGILQRSAAKEP